MMKIQILELIEGAKQAEGLAVIIDVFRAFTTECYAFDRGALLCYPVGELEEAFALKKEEAFEYKYGAHLLMIPDILNYLLTGKISNEFTNATMTLMTSQKTRSWEPEITIAMGKAGIESVPEDLLAAHYIRALLKGEDFPLEEEIERLRYHGAEQFFDPALAHIFPREDYPLCVAADRFPFVLRVEQIKREEKEQLVIRRVDPPF